jgi:hypothetical protein
MPYQQNKHTNCSTVPNSQCHHFCLGWRLVCSLLRIHNWFHHTSVIYSWICDIKIYRMKHKACRKTLFSFGFKKKTCYRHSMLWRLSAKFGGKCLSRSRNLQRQPRCKLYYAFSCLYNVDILEHTISIFPWHFCNKRLQYHMDCKICVTAVPCLCFFCLFNNVLSCIDCLFGSYILLNYKGSFELLKLLIILFIEVMVFDVFAIKKLLTCTCFFCHACCAICPHITARELVNGFYEI